MHLCWVLNIKNLCLNLFSKMTYCPFIKAPGLTLAAWLLGNTFIKKKSKTPCCIYYYAGFVACWSLVMHHLPLHYNTWAVSVFIFQAWLNVLWAHVRSGKSCLRNISPDFETFEILTTTDSEIPLRIFWPNGGSHFCLLCYMQGSLMDFFDLDHVMK